MLKQFKNRLLGNIRLQFDTATLSHIGGRDHLEDAVGYLAVDPNHIGWVLADGVGGQGAGEVASQLAVDTFLQGFRSQPDCSNNSLRHLLLSAHQAVFAGRKVNTPTFNMATTLVALLVAGNCAVWGHVGDSRLYHFRDGKLLHRTEDQSLVNMLLARGALNEADIATFAQRHVILQALGQDTTPEFVIHDPVKLKANDGFLLCSDGIWELISDTELLTLWQESHSANHWLSTLEQLIQPRVTAANATEKPADNYSAVAVKVHSG